ncbi:MAG: hypothetical protein U0165_02360 [Polyangiaceae bacterium]
MSRVEEPSNEVADLRSAPARIDSFRYPSSIAISSDGLVAVSDSGHHRVLIVDEVQNVVDVIGDGSVGLTNGSFDEVQLGDPQGLCWVGNELYICDAFHHVLIRASVGARTASVVAGTGRLGLAPLRGTRPGREVSLRSPTSLVLVGGSLLVTLAGSHQIGSLSLDTFEISSIVGRGEPGQADGHFENASLDEPTSLAVTREGLVVLDGSGTRARRVDLIRREVTTLWARLDRHVAQNKEPQWWSALASNGSSELILASQLTDTLDRLDPTRGRSRFFEYAQGVSLREPSAVAYHPARATWLVADTGNHRLIEIATTGDKASVFVLREPTTDRITSLPPSTSQPTSARQGSTRSTGDFDAPVSRSNDIPTQGLGPGRGVLLITPSIQASTWQLSLIEPVEVLVEVLRGGELLAVPDGWVPLSALPLEIPVLVHATPDVPSLAEVSVRMAMTLFHMASGQLVRTQTAVALPVIIDPGGAAELHYELALPIVESS